MNRNPLTDPRPGDRIQKGRTIRRVSDAVYQVDGTVTWQTQAGWLRFDSPESWRRWAKNATVFYAAPEPA